MAKRDVKLTLCKGARAYIYRARSPKITEPHSKERARDRAVNLCRGTEYRAQCNEADFLCTVCWVFFLSSFCLSPRDSILRAYISIRPQPARPMRHHPSFVIVRRRVIIVPDWPGTRNRAKGRAVGERMCTRPTLFIIIIAPARLTLLLHIGRVIFLLRPV